MRMGNDEPGASAVKLQPIKLSARKAKRFASAVLDAVGVTKWNSQPENTRARVPVASAAPRYPIDRVDATYSPWMACATVPLGRLNTNFVPPMFSPLTYGGEPLRSP